MISLILWRNFGWSAIARKTWMFNELAERNTRNTRKEENGEILLRDWHVKRKYLTSLFNRKDPMDEIILGGNAETTGIVLLFRTRGLVTRKYVGISGLKGAKLQRCQNGENFKAKCPRPRINFLI